MKKKIRGKGQLLEKKSVWNILVKKDQERFVKMSKPLLDQITEATKKNAHTEAFLLAWAFVEQILLPSLIRHIAQQLELKKIPTLNERIQVSQLISYYYFLSHDLKLYENLVKGNSLRRDLVHDLQVSDDGKKINQMAKIATEYTLKKIILLIVERLMNSKDIPVLALYINGRKDSIEKAIKEIKKL